MNHKLDYLNNLRTNLADALEARPEPQVRSPRLPRHRMSWRRALILVPVAAVAGVAFLAGSFTSRQVPTASADTIIGTIATGYAKSMGDAHPSQITYALTTRAVANQRTSQDHDPSQTQVYLIAIKGKFEDKNARTPGPNVHVTGRVITLVLDRDTYQVLDLGVGNQWPSFAGLNPTPAD